MTSLGNTFTMEKAPVQIIFGHYNFNLSSCKHVRIMNTPYTPLLYSQTGVYRGIHFSLIFALKHRLWVLVSEAVLTCTHDLYFKQK